MRVIPRRRRGSTPIRNTTAAAPRWACTRAAWSGTAARSRTTAAVVSWASWLRPPALSTICGLRRAAVDDERAGEARRRRSRAPSPTRSTFSSKRSCVLRRVRARGRGALGEDHDEERGRRPEQLRDVARATRPGSRRTAGRSARCPAPTRRRRRGRGRSSTTIAPMTAISAHGIFGVMPAAERRSRSTPTETATVSAFALADVLAAPRSLVERAARAAGHAEHPGHLAARDLDPDAGQEADQHRAREEVGEEAQAERAARGAAARPARIASIPASATYSDDPLRRHPARPGGQDRRGRRVGADDEVARRPEHGEHRASGSGSCRGR